jgi:23S rRNA pseudouridine1911/1915/1917 synthase
MIDDEIPAGLDGERVDRVVAMLTGCSRAEASAAIDAGTVHLDGATATKSSQRVTAGQRIRIEGDPVRVEQPPQADPAVDVVVVYEDDEVIVVDKPAGLVVHPGAGHEGATLVHGLLARYPELRGVGDDPVRPGIVHRLDKGTSGLLVVARTPRAHGALVEELADHRVDRHYRALVWGHLDTPRGTIDAPVGRSRRDPLKMTVTATGREARTHFEVLRRFDEPVPTSLLECRLETGRTHQIRVHLRSIHHPVVGDELYGGARPTLPMSRPFLHAVTLAFDHPATGERMSFESPLAPELVDVLDRLA